MSENNPITQALADIKKELGISGDFAMPMEWKERHESARPYYTHHVSFTETDPLVAAMLNQIIRDIFEYQQYGAGALREIHHRPPPGVEEGRNLTFDMLDQDVPVFLQVARHIRENLRDHPELKAQYREAVNLATHAIGNDRIEGANAVIRVKADKSEDLRVELLLVGAPRRLARQLAERTGQDFDSLRDSPNTPNASCTRFFEGGKTINIRMDAPAMKEISVLLMNYAEHAAQSRDPEARLKPGDWIGGRC